MSVTTMISGRASCYILSRVFLRYTLPPAHHVQISSRSIHQMFHLCCKKETQTSSSPLPTKLPRISAIEIDAESDILSEELMKSKTLERVMELAGMHCSIMNSKQLALAFRMIYECRSQNHSSLKALQQSETFTKLCSRLLKCARFLDSENTMSVFRTLSFVGLSSHTAVMQTVLQMLRHQVNELSLNQLTFLLYLLRKQHSTPIIEALKIAIPLVLQSQIEVQLNSESLSEVIWCLSVATRHKLKEECLVKLVSILLDKQDSLTPQYALLINQSLLHLKKPINGSEELFHVALDILSNNVQEVQLDSLLSLFYLGQLKGKTFYHWPLFKAVASRILKEDIRVSYVFLCASFFADCEFVVEDVLKKLAEMCCSNPEAANSDDRISVITMARIFALSGYQPPDIHKLCHFLINSPKLGQIRENFPDVMLNFLMCLAVLEFYPSELLRCILQSDALESLRSRSSEKGLWMQALKELRHLSMGLAAEASDISDVGVLQDVIREATEDAIQTAKERGYPVKEYLETALGGAAFVLTGMATKHGHVVDHAIVIRSGEYPVAVNTAEESSDEVSVRYLEDVSIPPAAKIITMTMLDASDYCKETSQLKGTTKLYLRTLKKLGYHPITLSLESWNDLLDRERIPYLMREVKNACLSEELQSGCTQHN